MQKLAASYSCFNTLLTRNFKVLLHRAVLFLVLDCLPPNKKTTSAILRACWFSTSPLRQTSQTYCKHIHDYCGAGWTSAWIHASQEAPDLPTKRARRGHGKKDGRGLGKGAFLGGGRLVWKADWTQQLGPGWDGLWHLRPDPKPCV